MNEPRAWYHPLLIALIVLSSLAAAQPLTVLVHDSFALSEEVLASFTATTGVKLRLLPVGDAGSLVNRAILTRRNPLGDVLYGIDNSLLARGLAVELFEPYRSPLLDGVPAALRFDPTFSVTPVDVGYVVFNLDRAFFEAAGLPLPDDLDRLLEPDYRALTVVQNPTSSSPGLAFLLTTVARYGEGGPGDWLDYWAALRGNELLVVNGWTNAYYLAFSRYGGDRPVVLSYATSPAAEVIFSEAPLSEAPTANLLCPRCAFRQIEAAGILAGTDNRAAAEMFIDFLLSRPVQEDVPLSMFVYPVVAGTPIPQEFLDHAAVPESAQVVELSPETIAENQQRWLEEWTEVVLQGRDPEEVRKRGN